MVGIVADRVIVELEAKLDKYDANVRRAEARFDTATKNIERSAKRMEQSVAASSTAIGAQFRTLAATFAASFTVQQVAALADTYTRFTNQLRVAGLEGQNLATTQGRLYDIAQRYGVQLESIGTLYGRATAVSKELGASEQQLQQFTTGVAAALKIQGTSAAESQGALLQLGQLLGSGRVQAEEFNSVLEGARPILVAVAKNFEGAGGSVSKLKQLVNDGKVSNQAFFQAFLQGSLELEAQAAKSTATIAQGFTILTNALAQYVGQTDASLGASERINAALVALSENLGTVATAIGIISALLLGRFVAGMVGAAASTGIASASLFALQARAIGAATSMEALAFAGAAAGRGLLAVFGGPVGLAVTALTLGIGYLVTTSNDAEQAADSLSSSIAAQSAQFSSLHAEQAATAAAQDNLSATQRAALTSTANLTGQADLLAQAWGRVAAQAKSAAIEQARAAYLTATRNVVGAGEQYNAARERGFQAAAQRPFAERGLSRDAPVINGPQALAAGERAAAKERAQLQEAIRNRRTARTELERLERTRLETFRPPAPVAPPVKPTKPKKTGTGRTRGKREMDPEEAARRFADDLARGQQELQDAMADAVGTAQARNDAERARIDADKQINARRIEAEEHYTAAQKQQLLALNDQVAAQRLAAIAAREAQEQAEARVDLAASELENQRDLLDAQQQLATTSAQRRDISLRLLDLQEQEEKLRLEAIVASQLATEAEKELARRRLAMLDDLYGARREGVERQNEGPLDRYRRGTRKSPEEMQEAAEQLIVDELEHVQKGISDAIASKLGTKDPLITGLIDLFIEQVIMRPIADAFESARSGGGTGSVVGSIISGIGAALGFGGKRASGGNVMAGRVYQVNENGIEGFQPAGSGKIIPLGRMRAAQAGGTTIHQTVSVDARGSVNPDGYADHIVSRVRQETVAIVGAASRGVTKGVPARLAQYNRDGL